MDEWTSLIERDRIERYAESFRQLAEIFREMPEKKERLNEEDIQEIFITVREKVCASCGKKQICWLREQEKTWKLAYGMMQSIEDGQEQRILSFLHKGKKFSRRTGTGIPAGQTEFAVDQPDDGESCSCGRTASADRSHY